MEKENVIIIIPYLSSGGAERTAINLAKNLKSEYNVRFVLFDASKNQYLYDKDIEIIDLGLTAQSNLLGKIKNTCKKIIKLKSIKKKYNIKFSISFLREPNFINTFTRTKNENIIISIRNKMSDLDDSKIKKFMTKYAAKHADNVVTLSKMVKYDQIKEYSANEKKVHVIYNACDIETIKKQADEKIEEKDIIELLDKNKGKIVINIGRLTFQKGQWHLIRAFKKVVNKIPDAKLIILGKGEMKEQLEQLVISSGLKDNVYLLGFFANPYKYLVKADIFAFSSQFEGLGNIILEAMACKKPIISTDCKYGPREILAPNTDLKSQTKTLEKAEYGILIPVCDNAVNNENGELSSEENIMADAIIELLSNKEELNKYREKSSERITFFSMKKNKNEWIKVMKGDSNV